MTDFEEEFEPMYRAAYRTAFRLLGDRPEAEDVAQETLARAYRSWGRIEEYAPAWIGRVSMNLALDRWRRTHRRLASQPADAALHVDDHAADRIDLHRALAGLPKRQREVVILRYLADLSEADVSRSLGCTLGTVKQHAHRGVERLRETLAQPAEVEGE